MTRSQPVSGPQEGPSITRGGLVKSEELTIWSSLGLGMSSPAGRASTVIRRTEWKHDPVSDTRQPCTFTLDPSAEDFAPRVPCRAGDYTLIKLVGTSALGPVYLGQRDDGTEHAVRVLRGRAHDQNIFWQERKALETAGNVPWRTKVVHLWSAWQEETLGGCYCLATKPFCSGGSLEDVIRSQAAPELRTRLYWALEVAQTLLKLHTAKHVRFVHGILTLRHVALHLRSESEGGSFEESEGKESEGDAFEAYLLHVVTARRDYLPKDSIEQQNTAVAPELEQSEQRHSQSADVWSWGVLLYGLLSWSVARMGLAPEKAWFVSLPGQDRGTWEHELQGPKVWGEEKGAEADEQPVQTEQWDQVLDLMVDCLRPEEERVGLETVVHVMRGVLGLPSEPSPLVSREQRRRQGRAQGGWTAGDEVNFWVARGKAHRELQQYAEEAACLERAVRLARTISEGPSHEIADGLTMIGRSYEKQKEYDRALPFVEEALAIRREALPPGHSDISDCLFQLACLYEKKGDQAKALLLYQESLDTLRAALPPGDLQVATLLDRLASLHANKHEYERALALGEEALAMRRAALPPKHADLAIPLCNVAAHYEGSGDYDKALSLYEEAVKLLPRGGSDHKTICERLVKLYKRKGDIDSAMSMLTDIMDLRNRDLVARYGYET